MFIARSGLKDLSGILKRQKTETVIFFSYVDNAPSLDLYLGTILTRFHRERNTPKC